MRYKRILPNFYKLISILNNLQAHSGEKIARELKISRNAVWKMVSFLRREAIIVESKQTKGYQLSAPLFLLDRKKIFQALPKKISDQIALELYAQLPSTNTYFLENAERNYEQPMFCLAESQTTGKGRMGRKWYSPFAQNIYLSCRWQLACDISKLSGLSLVIGLAVIKSLQAFNQGQKLTLKWPNDILYDGKKLGGVLIEMLAEAHSNTSVIIGVGINVNMLNDMSKIDQSWTSLKKISGKTIDRNLVVAELMTNMLQYIEQFLQLGLAAFMSQWRQYDYLYQKQITLQHLTKKITGTVLGIDLQGQLLIEQPDRTIITCAAGEATLH